MDTSTGRRVGAEAIGTALLLATVIGSGIMAERLAGGNQALALLCNTLPTGAILVVLITIFGPLSGAHFNPVVSLATGLRRDLPWLLVGAYVGAQIAGGVAGAFAAHLMFDLPVLQVSTTERAGPSQLFSEAVASMGLLLTILGTATAPNRTAWAVGLYIAAAYWFTASTSFANPAVTLARTLTDTFSGIRPLDAPGFIAAQIAGMLVALAFASWLWPRTIPVRRPTPSGRVP